MSLSKGKTTAPQRNVDAFITTVSSPCASGSGPGESGRRPSSLSRPRGHRRFMSKAVLCILGLLVAAALISPIAFEMSGTTAYYRSGEARIGMVAGLAAVEEEVLDEPDNEVEEVRHAKLCREVATVEVVSLMGSKVTSKVLASGPSHGASDKSRTGTALRHPAISNLLFRSSQKEKVPCSYKGGPTLESSLAAAKTRLLAKKSTDRCALICNGPSLNKMSWDWAHTFPGVILATNKFYMGMERFNGIEPDAYVVVNGLVAEQSWEEIQSLPEGTELFVGDKIAHR